MKLIIGLGNPGKEYEDTRHNAGFLFVDKLREKWTFPTFQMNKKFDAEISEGFLIPPLPLGEGRGEGTGKELADKILLAKPQTFMNKSGISVRKILDFYKLEPKDITVIHDDLDIERGKYKISEDSRSAGHNGVQDIIDHLGTQEFKRIRIGIAKSPEEKAACQLSGKDYVLDRFSEDEMKNLNDLFEKIIEKEL